ncbi:MAG: TIGR00282 family metallophosphoesterase [candidate division Zixibacteria bacterium]|nr:TIGR00282 family metallophosphoesterase [candidate division Zixibacteria bacterium]
MSEFKIIFIADVVGKPGRHILSQMTKRLKYKHNADYVIANTENAAGGSGITPEMAKKVFFYGVDCQTSGNHIWARQGIGDYLKEEPRLIRPANYPDAPGSGLYIGEANGQKIAIFNLMGRTYMYDIECPFRTIDRMLKKLDESVKIIIVDMHAEATSEKQAMWFYLDGLVSAVVGTHTHVQTADEQISGRGTAYITDMGMTGPHDSILGRKKKQALARFLYGRPIRLGVAEDDIKISGVVITVDPENSGMAVNIERFCMGLDMSLPLRDPEEELADAGEAD